MTAAILRGAPLGGESERAFLNYLNPPKNTPSTAPAWMEMNSASGALRPRLILLTTTTNMI
jgi:hypothetical protein